MSESKNIIFSVTCFVVLVILSIKQKNSHPLQQSKFTSDSVLSTDYSFIGDSILKRHKALLAHYFKVYNAKNCKAQVYSKKSLREGFEGFKRLGDINSDGKIDSIFVLNPLGMCEADTGQSYYFTNNNIPRLVSHSYCCHPRNIFSVGDIDEDGISEIGQYYSSCVSRYKSLHIYSLKNHKWKEIGVSTFDLKYMSYDKPFSHYVRKNGKNRFEMLEVTDLTNDKSKIGKPNWIKFSL
jgi:hypothetical protein